MTRSIIVAALAFLALSLLFQLSSTAQNLEIWCVWTDGSSGTGTLIKGPNGTVVLFDEGGGANWAEKCFDDIMDPNSIYYIDYAIAGHYDTDHIGGLDNLWDELNEASGKESEGRGHGNFGTYFDRGGSERDDGEPIPAQYYDLVDTSGQRDTVQVDGSDDIDLGSGATLQFLSVGATDTTSALYIRGRADVTTGISENNKSISVLITYGGFDMYLGSDLEGTGEKAVDDVVVTDLDRDADILLVDHHGADTYDINSLEFFENMDPEVALISVWNNSHEHPRKTPVYNLQQVVEPDIERIIRLDPGDDTPPNDDWAPETWSYCHTTNRHVYITTNGSSYTVDTVERAGGNDITDPDLTGHVTDEFGGGPTWTPTVTPTVTPTPEPGTGVVVNQVCPFSSPGEYVELYNNGASPVYLEGWELNVYSGDYTFTATDVIPAQGFFLVSDTNPVAGVVPDVETSIGISDNGVNSFAQLLNDSAEVQDTVGWADSSLFEGDILGTLPGGKAWKRNSEGVDTDNNSNDFSAIDPDPRNSSDSPPTATPTPTPTITPTPTMTPTLGPLDLPQNINFQPADASLPPGFMLDDASDYGTHGDYGWR